MAYEVQKTASAPLHDDRRVVLVVAVLATTVVGLDASVVSVALPAIRLDLGGGLVVQQWTVDAYLITLGSLVLVAGSLSDIFGRVRVITVGLVIFGLASLLCVAAPTGAFLVAGRAIQGVGGAIITPSSLALIVAAYHGGSQARAIGAWTAWSSAATIAAPVIGGLVVDVLGWRWIFVVTALPVILTVALVSRISRDVRSGTGERVDVPGALLAVAGVGAIVFGLIEQGQRGWGSVIVVGALSCGLLALIMFVIWLRNSPRPLVPVALFKNRNFSFGNLATFAIYGAYGLFSFILVLFLQEVWKYEAWLAGLATLPPTVVLLLLSEPFGSWSGKTGPRWFMAAGPAVAGVGFLLLRTSSAHAEYWTTLFPGLVIIGLGMAIMVSPLTSAILGAVPSAEAGTGSAVNNGVARVAGLTTVALAGVILGGEMSIAGFHRAIYVMTALLFAGAVIAAVGVRNDRGPGGMVPQLKKTSPIRAKLPKRNYGEKDYHARIRNDEK